MKKLITIMFVLLGVSLVAENTAPSNRISFSASAWPPVNMLTLTRAGLAYERVVSNYVALSAGGNFDFMGHMHGGLIGGGAHIGANFMVFSHGDHAFQKGIVAGLTTGVDLGQSWSTGGDPRDGRTRRFFEIWFPLMVQADYIYTWETNFFLGAGIASELVRGKFTKSKNAFVMESFAYPRLELLAGIAF